MFSGCPKGIRIDCGTKNAKIAEWQIALRMFHSDNHARDKSVQYGPFQLIPYVGLTQVVVRYVMFDMCCGFESHPSVFNQRFITCLAYVCYIENDAHHMYHAEN